MNNLLRHIYDHIVLSIREVISELTAGAVFKEVILEGDMLMQQMKDLLGKLDISKTHDQYLLTSPNIALFLTAEAGEELNDTVPTIKIHGHIGRCIIYSDMFMAPDQVLLIEDTPNGVRLVDAIKVVLAASKSDLAGIYHTIKL